MTRIGVVVHEMGHMFCLPDQLPGVGCWVGNYDCMGNMWGRDGSQYYSWPMGAWSRVTVGWVTSTVIGQPGRYSIKAAVDAPQAYKIIHGFPAGEYLLVENRVQREYDGMLADQHGIVIWHIDDNESGETLIIEENPWYSW